MATSFSTFGQLLALSEKEAAMTDMRKLRDELDSLDGLIEVQSAALDRLLRQQHGAPGEATTRYPASFKQMQEMGAAQRELYEASSRLNELCWQRAIKREILRLLEQGETRSTRALSV